jgi:hypothetical protein
MRRLPKRRKWLLVSRCQGDGVGLMTSFDTADYEARVVRPLRGLAQLPDDLITRYAIDLGMHDSQVAERVRQVRAYWGKKARFETNIGMVCRAFIRAHSELEGTYGDRLHTIRWWQQWDEQRCAARRPERDQLVATLRAAFGDIGMITSGHVGAEAAAFPDLSSSEIAKATELAALTVIGPDQLPPLPSRSGLTPDSYSTLRQRIIDAGLRSVPALLVDNLQTFRIIDQFSATPPVPNGLSAKSVEAARERINRVADTPTNRAIKEAIGLLETAANQGVDLRVLTLFHLLDPVRASRAQPPSLWRQLCQAGLDRDEASKIVLSLLWDSATITADPVDVVKQLLTDGQLMAAQKASAALTGEGAAAVRELVRDQTERVAQLRTTASAELAAGREEQAALRLQQAVRLAADLPELAAELARLPLPPVLDLTVLPEGFGVRLGWRASPSHGESTRYRVVRKVGRAPGSSADGQVIAITATLAMDDQAPPVGRPVFYAVSAGQGTGVWSRPAVQEIRVVPPVSHVQATGERDAIAVHWRAHPEVVEVRAQRKTASAQKPLAVTNNSIRDSDVTDGVEYLYSIVAVYHCADRDSEITAAPVVVRAATRPDLAPVTELRVQSADPATDLRVHVAWRQPVGAQVVLRRDAAAPSWAVGEWVSAAEIANYGQELAGAPILRDGWMTLIAPVEPGHSIYVPFTVDHHGVDQHGGIRGQEAAFAFTLPVRQLRGERFGSELLLSWVWPDEVAVAEVTWPGGTRRISRQQYRDEGGCRISLGPQAATLEVSAIMLGAREASRSTPAVVQIGGERPRLSYTLQRRGSRLTGGVRCTVRFESSASLQCTVLVVVAEGHSMPLDATAGQVLARLDDMVVPGAESVLELTLPRLRRPYWVRCFVADDDKVLLVDPPLSQLKVP